MNDRSYKLYSYLSQKLAILYWLLNAKESLTHEIHGFRTYTWESYQPGFPFDLILGKFFKFYRSQFSHL